MSCVSWSTKSLFRLRINSCCCCSFISIWNCCLFRETFCRLIIFLDPTRVNLVLGDSPFSKNSVLHWFGQLDKTTLSRRLNLNNLPIIFILISSNTVRIKSIILWWCSQSFIFVWHFDNILCRAFILFSRRLLYISLPTSTNIIQLLICF